MKRVTLEGKALIGFWLAFIILEGLLIIGGNYSRLSEYLSIVFGLLGFLAMAIFTTTIFGNDKFSETIEYISELLTHSTNQSFVIINPEQKNKAISFMQNLLEAPVKTLRLK